MTTNDVLTVCDRHGWTSNDGPTKRAIRMLEIDKITSHSQIEDQLIEAAVLTGPKLFEPSVKENYEGGECPDCGETIPDDAAVGQECSTCGHVWANVVEGEEVETIQVIVGNIGTVYSGNDKAEAIRVYNVYVDQSQNLPGCRAYQEKVVIMENDDIDQQHQYIPSGNDEGLEEDFDLETPQQVADQDFAKQHPHEGDED